MLLRIFLILLFVINCKGFFTIDISAINNRTTNRLNLTCSYYGDIAINCEYCVYQFYSNGSATTIYYDCIQITNTYKSISKQCQGFSDNTDIGYGICSPLSFELFNMSILCICATNMCNTNLTTCQSSVNYQVQSNLSPSVLPSIVPDLSTPISCVDTTVLSSDLLNASYYCAAFASPYINLKKCNEYVVNNTVLCLYLTNDNYQLPMALTKDSYNVYLVQTLSDLNQYVPNVTIQQLYNETSSYFYLNLNVTYTNYNTTRMFQRCYCAQDNCNYNLTNCLNANRSILIKNNATKNINNMLLSLWIDMIVKLLLVFGSIKLIVDI